MRILALAICLAALGPLSTVAAQDAERSVSALSASSPAAGEVAVSWTAPSEVPASYRLSWAPAGGGYTSYKEDNSATGGNVYPAGVATSHKLTGLAAGRYRVWVKARYTDGTGPWSKSEPVEVSAVVELDSRSDDESLVDTRSTDTRQTQTDDTRVFTLVSTLNQPWSGHGFYSIGATPPAMWVHFNTGPNTGGYVLTAVVVSTYNSEPISLKVCNRALPAGERCVDLTAPTTMVSGHNSFTPPANTILTASTKYTIEVSRVAEGSLDVDTTLSREQDHGGFPGWKADEQLNVGGGSGQYGPISRVDSIIDDFSLQPLFGQDPSNIHLIPNNQGRVTRWTWNWRYAVKGRPVNAPTNLASYFSDEDDTAGGDPVTFTVGENLSEHSLIGVVAGFDPDGDALTYSYEGADLAAFQEDFRHDASNGKIIVKAGRSTDHERRSSYSLTIKVSDGKDSSGSASSAIDDSVAVTIRVRNDQEQGELTLSTNSPSEGSPITATLTDQDGSIEVVNWYWRYLPSGESTWRDIRFESTAQTTESTFTPGLREVGAKLSVSVLYGDAAGIASHTDNTGRILLRMDTGPTSTGVNTPPSFSAARYDFEVPYAEFTYGTRNGLFEIDVTDLDHEDVTVTVGGTDATAFNNMFELREPYDAIVLKAGEDRQGGKLPQPVYRFTLTATDPRGGSATVHAAITVTDHPNADSEPEEETNSAPRFSSSSNSLTVEASMLPGDPVGSPLRVDDDDGDSLTYRLEGSDAHLFEIDPQSGEIRLRPQATLSPDVQLELTVVATDPDGMEDRASLTLYVGPAGDPNTPISQTTAKSAGGGFGGGGGGGGAPAPPKPSEADFDWNVTRDIAPLHRDHVVPTGMWSDGETLFLLNNAAGGQDAVFAYDLQTGQRRAQREFALDRRNRFSHGLWSDGETAWVADSQRDRLFAYRLASGERLETLEFELAERNADPRGIWSEGGSLYVLDGVKDALFIYDLNDGRWLAEHALATLNKSPRDIWSDGAAIWVSDDVAKRIFAYQLAEGALTRVHAEEFGFRSLLKAGNGDPSGIWADGEVIYVADLTDNRIYTYNLPDAIDARLKSLILVDIDIGGFSPLREQYRVLPLPSAASATIKASTAQAEARVSITPGSKVGDGSYRIEIIDGLEVLVTVSSPDGSRQRHYTIRFGPPPPAPDCLRGLGEQRLSRVSFEGGGLDDLRRCALNQGVRALFHLDGARWRLFVVDGPGFLNRAFLEHFAQGLPAGLPLVALKGG